MNISDVLVSPSGLGEACSGSDRPLIVVDLRTSEQGEWPDIAPLCPVIGVGDRAHPLAARLDAIAGDEMDALGLAQACGSQPLAAEVLVGLLRLLPAMSLEEGLVLESLAYATLQASASHREWIAGRSPAPTATGEGRVILEREDATLRMTLDRPEAGNAIDRPMRDALHEGLALANADREITQVILCARGKAFSLGADLGEFGTTRDPATAHAIRRRTLPANEAARCADRLHVHVDGACVGAGLELAAFASRLTATPRSWFQLPELAMGIIPGAGGCVSLTKRIGRQRTAELVLSGRRIGARRALEIGLVDAIMDEPS